jgi:hypothetical protein
VREEEREPTQGTWDPRRDRDPQEPVDHPPQDEPADDPDNPIPGDPVDEPVDSPGVGEPERRDPDPKEPERRLREKALSLERAAFRRLLDGQFRGNLVQNLSPGTFRRDRSIQMGGSPVHLEGKGPSRRALPRGPQPAHRGA